MVGSSGAVGDALAEQALWPQGEDQDQDDEGEDVLVVAAEDAAGELADVAGTERLDHAEQHAADHRAGEVAAYITPASAASEAPMTKVAEITMSGLTPISAATRGFSAVARIARPSLVRLTSHIRPASVTAVTARISSWIVLMTAPPMWKGS